MKGNLVKQNKVNTDYKVLVNYNTGTALIKINKLYYLKKRIQKQLMII
jgi:hypothetical protein